jgi:predicted aspartyl protease
MGLIDTGASVTCIDDEAAKALQLPVVDVVNMTSATHASTPSNVYPIQIQLLGVKIVFQAPRAIGAELKSQDLLLLIGRDVLQRCTLHYNGLVGQFTLAI